MVLRGDSAGLREEEGGGPDRHTGAGGSGRHAQEDLERSRARQRAAAGRESDSGREAPRYGRQGLCPRGLSEAESLTTA